MSTILNTLDSSTLLNVMFAIPDHLTSKHQARASIWIQEALRLHRNANQGTRELTVPSKENHPYYTAGLYSGIS